MFKIKKIKMNMFVDETNDWQVKNAFLNKDGLENKWNKKNGQKGDRQFF